MGTDKISPLMSILNSRYAVSAPKRVEGGNGSQEVGKTGFEPTVNYSDPNIFAGNLTGVNTNIGVGDYQYAQEQAGRKLSGTTLTFA